MRTLLASLLAISISACAYPLLPTKLEDNCARETGNVETEKYLVSILTLTPKMEPHYLGSGFVTAKNGKTFIATSAHVALKNTKTGEQHPGGVFIEVNDGLKQIILKAGVAAVNIKSDVALLQTNHAFQSAARPASKENAPGSCVVAAGYGFASRKPAKVSGNFYGYFPLSVKIWDVRVDAMVITAHVIDGISGGPVFNKDNEVIGIFNNSVVIKKEDGTETRFSLAIPITELPSPP